jgi:hypothetical protein
MTTTAILDICVCVKALDLVIHTLTYKMYDTFRNHDHHTIRMCRNIININRKHVCSRTCVYDGVRYITIIVHCVYIYAKHGTIRKCRIRIIMLGGVG